MCDRILGLDYGDKTIGVALSDALGITAQGLFTIFRDNEESLKKSIARLAEIIKEYNVKTIVLGYPKNMDNTEGIRCEKTLAFKDKLERNFKKLTVVLWDERLSTMAADRILTSAGCINNTGRRTFRHDSRQANYRTDCRSDYKKVVDKIAAVYILQGYLDKFNNERSNK